MYEPRTYSFTHTHTHTHFRHLLYHHKRKSQGFSNTTTLFPRPSSGVVLEHYWNSRAFTHHPPGVFPFGDNFNSMFCWQCGVGIVQLLQQLSPQVPVGRQSIIIVTFSCQSSQTQLKLQSSHNVSVSVIWWYSHHFSPSLMAGLEMWGPREHIGNLMGTYGGNMLGTKSKWLLALTVADARLPRLQLLGTACRRLFGLCPLVECTARGTDPTHYLSEDPWQLCIPSKLGMPGRLLTGLRRARQSRLTHSTGLRRARQSRLTQSVKSVTAFGWWGWCILEK
jgi:hypothetical protein